MYNKKITFKGEIPITIHNRSVYDKIFIIESWFRRIVSVALMIKHGRNWTDIFTKEDKSKYYKNVKKSKKDPSLDCGESNNMLWFTNIFQLMEILKKEEIKDIVIELTKKTPDETHDEFEIIRKIRNNLAHSRIITMDSLNRFNETYESLFNAILNFKDRFLYASSYEIHHSFEYEDYKDDNILYYFNKRMHGNDWSFFQAFIAEDKYFYKIVQLPCKLPDGYSDEYVDVKKLLNSYFPVMNSMIGIFINKSGNEYSVVWPKHCSISEKDQIKIIDIFLEMKHKIWTNLRYEQQNEKFICNPFVWFYENNQPIIYEE